VFQIGVSLNLASVTSHLLVWNRSMLFPQPSLLLGLLLLKLYLLLAGIQSLLFTIVIRLSCLQVALLKVALYSGLVGDG